MPVPMKTMKSKPSCVARQTDWSCFICPLIVPASILQSACGGYSAERLPTMSYSRPSTPFWLLPATSLTVATIISTKSCPLSKLIHHDFFACTYEVIRDEELGAWHRLNFSA